MTEDSTPRSISPARISAGSSVAPLPLTSRYLTLPARHSSAAESRRNWKAQLGTDVFVRWSNTVADVPSTSPTSTNGTLSTSENKNAWDSQVWNRATSQMVAIASEATPHATATAIAIILRIRRMALPDCILRRAGSSRPASDQIARLDVGTLVGEHAGDGAAVG